MLDKLGTIITKHVIGAGYNMRQSQKAWVWRSIPALTMGSPVEAYAAAKANEVQEEVLILKGRSRNLLPRT